MEALTPEFDHVVLDFENDYFVCQHCGDKFPVPYGRPTFFGSVLQAFMKCHKACKPGSQGGRGFSKLLQQTRRRGE